MSWENVVRTGNQQQDWQQAMAMKAQAESQGMRVDVQPLPQGGVLVRAQAYAPAPQPQPMYGAPQPQQPPPYGPPPGYNAGAYGAAPVMMAPSMSGGYAPPQPSIAYGAPGVASMGEARVRYLRKVYGYLLGASTVGIAAGWATLNLGPTAEVATSTGKAIEMPLLVALVLQNRIVDIGLFLVLLAAIAGASTVSKVKGINVAALFGVGAIMGVEFAPMIWVASFFAGMGQTLTADPVRDAFLMTGAVFAGATGYVFVTKKDFSYLGASLSMGAIVVLVACGLSFLFHSEAFTLAVCSVGAIVASGLILYQTSQIFNSSDMDDPVDDALGLLIQLRNLLMFLMRIFMSRR